MITARSLLWACALAVLCAGCGGKTVVREETAVFVVASAAAQDKVKAFYNDLAKSDLNYVTSLRAMQPRGCSVDEECTLGQTQEGGSGPIEVWASARPRDLRPLTAGDSCKLYRTGVETLSNTKPVSLQQWIQAERRYNRVLGDHALSLDDGFRCAEHLLGDAGRKQHFPDPQARTVLKPPYFKAELAVIDGYSSYLTALGKLAEDPDSDVAGEIEKALAKFDKAQELARIPDDERAKLSDTEKGKLDAIVAVVDHFRKLYKNARQAGEIRKLVRESGAAFEADIRNLAGTVDRHFYTLEVVIKQDHATQLAALYRRGDAFASTAERLAALPLYLSAKELDLATASWKQDPTAPPPTSRKPSPVGSVLVKLADAQAALAQVVDGNLTPEQRKRAVKTTWDQVRTSLELIVESVTPFI